MVTDAGEREGKGYRKGHIRAATRGPVKVRARFFGGGELRLFGTSQTWGWVGKFVINYAAP